MGEIWLMVALRIVTLVRHCTTCYAASILAAQLSDLWRSTRSKGHRLWSYGSESVPKAVLTRESDEVPSKNAVQSDTA